MCHWYETKQCHHFLSKHYISYIISFLRCFRDLIRVPRISNRVPIIRENYIIGSLKSEKIGSIESEKSAPYRSILGT